MPSVQQPRRQLTGRAIHQGNNPMKCITHPPHCQHLLSSICLHSTALNGYHHSTQPEALVPKAAGGYAKCLIHHPVAASGWLDAAERRRCAGGVAELAVSTSIQYLLRMKPLHLAAENALCVNSVTAEL